MVFDHTANPNFNGPTNILFMHKFAFIYGFVRYKKFLFRIVFILSGFTFFSSLFDHQFNIGCCCSSNTNNNKFSQPTHTHTHTDEFSWLSIVDDSNLILMWYRVNVIFLTSHLLSVNIYIQMQTCTLFAMNTIYTNTLDASIILYSLH